MKKKSKSLYDWKKYGYGSQPTYDPNKLTQQKTPDIATETTKAATTATTTTKTAGDKASAGMGYAAAGLDTATGIADAIQSTPKDLGAQDPRVQALFKKAKALRIAAATTGGVGAGLSFATYGISGVVGGAAAYGMTVAANKRESEAKSLMASNARTAKRQQQDQMKVMEGMEANPNVTTDITPNYSVASGSKAKSNSLFRSTVNSELGGGDGDGDGYASGVIHGKKNDQEPSKLHEGMVIPDKPPGNVARFLQSSDAKALGLTAKKADHRQPGGDPGRVTGGEYWVQQEKVNEAGMRNIDLQKWAPNATESIGKGSNSANGSLLNYKANPGTVADTTTTTDILDKPLPSRIKEGTKRYDRWLVEQKLTDKEKLALKAKRANIAGTAANALLGVTQLAVNASRKFKPGEHEDFAAATPLSENLDTTHEENETKGMYLAGKQAFVEQGGNPAVFSMSPYMKMLSELASKRERHRFLIRNRNAEAQDLVSQANVEGRRQFRREEGARKDQFRTEKTSAIGQNLTDLAQLPFDYMTNSLAIGGYKAYI